jgi:hypothetical protein
METTRAGKYHLRADGLRQCVGHRAMIKRAEQPALAIHGEIARGQHRGRSHIAGENRVLRGEPVQHRAEVLRMHISAAQKSNTKDWGKATDGLQMSIYHDQAEGRSEFSKFRVEFRNTGRNDLLLNLGIMSRNKGQEYLNAVSLILEDGQGEPQWLELKRSFQASDAGYTMLFLPLPVGATYSFPVDLDNYWAPTSNDFDAARLKPGTYWLAAQFIRGFAGADGRVVIRTAHGTEQSGPPILPVRTFDMETTLDAPPISNTLRLEVPSR